MSDLIPHSMHADILDLPGVLAVRSVFDHAWQLLHESGRIVTIGSMTYDGPLAIRVSEARLRDVSMEPGAAATIDGRTLTIGSLRIPLEGVPLWRPQSPRRDPG
ncbi:MAG: hypothetical protein ACRDFX_08015, partial [Chloroflexota bacterium]